MIAQKRKITINVSVKERARLMAARGLALRCQDRDEVCRIDVLLAASSVADEPAETKDPLTLVNERNRKANIEAVRRAEIFEAE
jgi:RNA polymerase-associated protein RTF1